MSAQSQEVLPDESNQCTGNSNQTIKKPTETYDECWLYHVNSDIAAEYCEIVDPTEWGKWMMFVKKPELDQLWENCCKLYDERKLTGIHCMKCSTNYKNPRSSDHSSGVIIIYCGPASDESKMIEYGKNLLKYIPYYNSYGFMAYKSDMQTRGGTRKTGQTKNHLYKIPVPKTKFELNSLT